MPSTSFVAIPSSTWHECKWIQDKHEAFLTGRTKYGNKWMKIAMTIQTRTVTQIKRQAQIYDQTKKNKKAAAVLQYRKSLTPKKKGCIVKSNTAAHTKNVNLSCPRKNPICWKSMLPNKKNTANLSRLRKKPICWKSMLPNKKNTANLSHPRKKPIC